MWHRQRHLPELDHFGDTELDSRAGAPAVDWGRLPGNRVPAVRRWHGLGMFLNELGKKDTNDQSWLRSNLASGSVTNLTAGLVVGG